MSDDPLENNENENEDDEEDALADRPLECSECKKDIAVLYTEIVGQTITHTCMCKDCPELQRRLYGTSSQRLYDPNLENNASLACGNCGMTFNSLHIGAFLGCSVCYEVFSKVLIGELLAAKKIPSRITTNKKSIPIHIGRTPGESVTMNPSLRLLALNEALNETIKAEDYEQSAWLRDQIKALTENPENTNEGKE